MGRSYTPAYRIESSNPCFTGAWNRKVMGAPNADNLIKHAEAMSDSTRMGGCNEHVGFQPVPEWIRIVRQSDNKIMAEALFQKWHPVFGWVLNRRNDGSGWVNVKCNRRFEWEK